MRTNAIKIKTPKGWRLIGPGQPVFVVAEMSGNHKGDINRAYKIIDAAAAAGADAVKLQTFKPELLTLDISTKLFQIKVNRAWSNKTLFELYKEVYTPWEWQPKLKAYAEKEGLFCFSSVVDETGVDFLEKLKMSMYKVGSFEITDIELLKRIGKTKKPVIISRGLASVNDIRLALRTLKQSGCPMAAVLHCISSYPAKPEQMNLRTIADIAKKFKVISGLSDHTLGIAVSVGAAALGASIIERHVTLKRADGGPDAAFSLEPAELKALVAAVRETEAALGKPCYRVGKREAENIIFRRSLFAVNDMLTGDKFTKKNVRSIRPGYGLPPKFLPQVIGRSARINIKRGTPLEWKLIK